MVRLTEEKLPAKPKDTQIKLYVYKVQRPHREIAFIDSQPLPDRSEQSQEKQLLQIREAARKLGADAVHDIQSMTERVQGMVTDQRVPFRAYKQGQYKLYFIRGTAIVYTLDHTTPETPPSPPEPEILDQETSYQPPSPTEAQETPVVAPVIEESTPPN